jgi:catechol 2,3-dioxygenase-like lactoylglutathione lyase family enzyme
MRMIVNIDVPELAPAIAFYTSALGLHLNRIIDDDVAELDGRSSTIYLLAKPAKSPSSISSDVRQYARHWTPVHIDFVVDNLDAAASIAIAAGAIKENELVKWHGSKCITFADPFGHGFCLIEFDGETYT